MMSLAHATSRRNDWRALLTTLSLLALSGCASVYLVDNQVQSFARWGVITTPATGGASGPQPPQIYRFERLPSQQVGQAVVNQDDLESLVRAALLQVGWTLAETGTAAPWTVQVATGTVRLPRAPWEEPWGGMGFLGHDPLFVGGGMFWDSGFMRLDSPYYQRKISLLIRHAGSGQVVYETHAAHDGIWNGTPELWSAMLSAALRDFPMPPDGTRQVNIEVPR